MVGFDTILVKLAKEIRKRIVLQYEGEYIESNIELPHKIIPSKFSQCSPLPFKYKEIVYSFEKDDNLSYFGEINPDNIRRISFETFKELKIDLFFITKFFTSLKDEKKSNLYLFKYKNFESQHTILTLNDYDLYIPDQTELDDIFDLQQIHYFNNLSFDQHLPEINKRRIISFSANKDISLMWNLYSKNKNGVCIEYDSEEIINCVRGKSAIFARVFYTNVKKLFEVLSNSYSQILGSATLEVMSILLLFVKSSSWGVQKEVRMLILDSEPKIIKPVYSNLYFLEGSKMSSNFPNSKIIHVNDLK